VHSGSPAEPPLSVAILTVSGAVAAGEAEDGAGTLLRRLAGEAGACVVALEAVPDDRERIEARLRAHVADGVALILTVGGTGLTHDDVTPEATGAVIDREAPGFAEALRAESLRHTPMGMLTRGRAGIAERTLIVNLPGSPKAVRELFGVLAPVLRHAVDTIRSPAGSRALHARAGGGRGRA
jgi:molybdopterin adenylyltransferase